MSSLKLPEHPGLPPGAAERMPRNSGSGNLTLVPSPGECHVNCIYRYRAQQGSGKAIVINMCVPHTSGFHNKVPASADLFVGHSQAPSWGSLSRAVTLPTEDASPLVVGCDSPMAHLLLCF